MNLFFPLDCLLINIGNKHTCAVMQNQWGVCKGGMFRFVGILLFKIDFIHYSNISYLIICHKISIIPVVINLDIFFI